MASSIKGYIFVFSALLFSCKSSIIPSLPEHDQIVLTEGDSVYTFRILNASESEKIKPEDRSFYFYYTHGVVKKVEGAHHGKLLHGNFSLENSQHALLERGKFQYGRKTGEWKSWYGNGYLKEVVNWERGAQQGKFFEYSPTGSILKQGSYRDGKLHGEVITVVNGQKEKAKYDNGELIVPKPKKEKVKKERVKKEKADTGKEDQNQKDGTEKEKKRSKKEKSADKAPEDKPQKKREKKSKTGSDGQEIRKK